jgi:hypothetical protein
MTITFLWKDVQVEKGNCVEACDTGIEIVVRFPLSRASENAKRNLPSAFPGIYQSQKKAQKRPLPVCQAYHQA